MYSEKRVVSIITSKMLESGFWKVHYELVQSRKELDGEWKSKSIEAAVTSESESDAFNKAASEVFAYLSSVNGDLFNNPNLGKEDEQWKKSLS